MVCLSVKSNHLNADTFEILAVALTFDEIMCQDIFVKGNTVVYVNQDDIVVCAKCYRSVMFAVFLIARNILLAQIWEHCFVDDNNNVLDYRILGMFPGLGCGGAGKEVCLSPI